jgi:acetyl-CoA acyltransferase
MATDRVVFIDGVRTPFLRSGTEVKNLMAYDLARKALRGLLNRTGVSGADIGYVMLGTVIQEVRTSNIAREAAMAAGIPNSVPAHTVTQACISSNQAAAGIAEKIMAGRIAMGIAGGVETMSDVPIRLSRNMRAKMLDAQKIKSPLGWLQWALSIKLRDLAPELPAIAEFSTGETMGKSADRLAAAFNISRNDQDLFALRSHQLAAKAKENGWLSAEIVPLVNERGVSIDFDNGVRGDSTIEKLSSLKPAFIKPYGTVTAGNASFLTDGASAGLFASESEARRLGLQPKTVIKDYVFVSQDPQDELLLGPAYAVPRVLKAAGLTLADIDVFEFHEAFAGQILANLAALESKTFAEKKLGLSAAVGSIPMEKFNTCGGSLSIGHPFGATGVRLITTASNRLMRENGKYALIAACAAGGQGHAMILERV